MAVDSTRKRIATIATGGAVLLPLPDADVAPFDRASLSSVYGPTLDETSTIAAPNISYSGHPYLIPLNNPAAIGPTNSGGASTDWTVTAGSLPTGMALAPTTGVISGTPTVENTFNATIQATNVTGSDTFDIEIEVTAVVSKPAINYASPFVLQAGIDVGTLSPTNTGGASTDWVVARGMLPFGLSINATTGAITGTPLNPGVFNVQIHASNIIGIGARGVEFIVREQNTLGAGGTSGVHKALWHAWGY